MTLRAAHVARPEWVPERVSQRTPIFSSCGYTVPVPPVTIAPPEVTVSQLNLVSRAHLHPVRPPRSSSVAPARISGVVVAVIGFVLLATAVATGAPEGVWPSVVFVGAAVPLRHSLESGSPEPRRHPGRLLVSLLMIAGGVLLAVL